MGKLEYILMAVVLVFAVALALGPLKDSTGASIVDIQSEQIIEHTATDTMENTEIIQAGTETLGVKAGKIRLTVPEEIKNSIKTDNEETNTEEFQKNIADIANSEQANDKYVVTELIRNRGTAYGYVRNTETGKKYALEMTDDSDIEEYEFVNVLEWKKSTNGKVAVKVKEISNS